MIRQVSGYIFQFLILVLLQVFILNNIQLGGCVNPYIYILFILLLPVNIPKWLLLVLGFVLGITIDLFTHTPGMNSSATVFMAFIRPYILEIIAPREGYEKDSSPRLSIYGFTWFLRYSVILVLAHHFALFYIEVFRFADFFLTFSRVILSAAFSILLIVSSQYLIYRD
jgi:rod shape-determining protein MreD